MAEQQSMAQDTSSSSALKRRNVVLVATERCVLYIFFVGLWIFIQWPILGALLFRERYGFVCFPLSVALMCAARYRGGGGMTEVHRELRTVATDVCFPLWYISHTFQTLDNDITTSEWTQELLRRLATLSKYLFMYGPLSFGGAVMLLAPWALLLQPMVFQDWFPPLQFAALVYATMMCCAVVTNACMHRFFSHASFKSSRPVTFLLGLVGCLGGQFGPLWWASNHRRHHKYCETTQDVHCPAIHGFWYAHCGWIMDNDNFPIRPEYLPKVGKEWPELMILDVFCTNLQFAAFYLLARGLKHWAPEQANAPGFLFQQIVLGPDEGYVLDVNDISAQYIDTALILGYGLFLHCEFLINSWCHTWSHEEKTQEGGTCKGLDFYWVGLLNAGEGFHANHHQFPAEAQHGPQWYYDWSYCFIAALESAGLVWDVVRPSGKKKMSID